MVRRLVMVAAVIGWFRRRVNQPSQQIRLKKGETLLVEVVRPEKTGR